MSHCLQRRRRDRGLRVFGMRAAQTAMWVRVVYLLLIPPYFRAPIGKHAAFYRVATDGELLIVRVLHSAMLPELHPRFFRPWRSFDSTAPAASVC